MQAVAVSSSILPFLVSLYTILVTSAVISLWGCVFAVFLRHRLERNRTNALYAALWNKRYSLADTFFEIVPLKGQRKKWGQPSFAPLLCLTFCFLVGQAALAILSPSAIILGRAAPVDPTSIVLPRGSNDINGAFRTAAYDLPAALRAAGSVRVATRELEDQAPVKEIPVGATADGKTINGYQYGYNISGRDLGLQRFSTLRLAVNGGCVTDYGLLSNINTSVQVDTYRVFGDPDSRKPISLGWLDGPGPSLTFILPKPAKPPTTWQTNMTWAVYVSSAYRLSYTAGRDPFYETEEINGPLGFPFQVKPGRPVLSCWESNVWWYGGNSFDNTLNLSSTTLPGFDLPHSLLRVLAKYFGVPSIVRVGQLLGYAGLRTEPVIGLSLNASRTSMLGDLKRLVLTSYIASTATFTDTTLYESLPPGLNNTAIGDDGKPLDGLGDFVVWSSDVAALSLWYIIVIPLLTFSLWLLLLLLLKCTRLRIVKALNASVLYEVIRDNLPEIGPHPSGTWRKYVPFRGSTVRTLATHQADGLIAGAGAASRTRTPGGGPDGCPGSHWINLRWIR